MSVLLSLLRRWRTLALLAVVTVTVSAVINFMLLPKWYQARTVIMPPQEKSSFSGLGMVLSRVQNLPGGVERLVSGMTGFSPSQYLFVVILNSSTVADSLIDKYDLQKVYKTKYRFQARRELQDHTVIDFPPEGHIVIKVEAREDSVLAASLANEYVEQLNNVLMDRGIYAATRKRKFLEERLQSTKKDLAVIEDSLRQFKEKYKIIEPEEQAKGAVELITGPVLGMIKLLGELEAEKEGRKIYMATLEDFFTSRHPQINRLKSEIRELDRAIANIKSELFSTSYMDDKSLIVAFSDIPGIALAYTRLYREVKIQEEMFILLSAQYEEARVNEADDTPGAIVLDRAAVPEYKSRPKRLLNILISLGAALALGVGIILLQERLKNVDLDRHLG